MSVVDKNYNLRASGKEVSKGGDPQEYVAYGTMNTIPRGENA